MLFTKGDQARALLGQLPYLLLLFVAPRLCCEQVPLAICNLVHERQGGGVRKLPGRLFARVPVRFGEPVAPQDVSAEKLELLVRTLRGNLR